MKRFLRTLFLLLVSMAIPAFSSAQESLDPDFGSNGQLTTGFSIYNDEAYAIAVQADGKILVAGQSENGADTDIALARYNTNGTLDTDFNTDGQVTVSVGSGDDSGLAMTVQEDGKILVAGTMNNGNNKDIALIRLTAEGLLDMDFDQDGQMSISLPDTNDSASAVLLQKDGKIVLAGTSEGSTASHLFVARLNSDGSPDSGFGSNGIVSDTGKNDSAVYSAVLQDNGNILLAGFAVSDNEKQAALFSFLGDGQVNKNFGNQGVGLVGSDSKDSVFYDLALLEDGNILAAGSIQEESYRSILLAGFLATGTVNQDFSSQGIVRADLGTDSVAYGLAIASDGSIYLSGSGSNDQDKDFILLHYTASGQPVINITEPQTKTAAAQSSTTETVVISSLKVLDSLSTEEDAATKDPTYILTDFEEYNDIARAIYIQDDGSILLAGTVGKGKDTDFGLLRFSTTDLALKRVTDGLETTEGYYIATTPPTRVTRNSAATGGFIESISSDPLPVNTRGVCYGITSAPGLKNVTETDQTTATTTTTDTTTTTGSTTETAGSLVMPVTKEIVYEGCTSDGSGVGAFRSDILNVTPDTLYYVRAYAELSDGTVIYGNELQFKTEGACFIATAAYGSPDHSYVLTLRQFRDTYLKSSSLGRKLISNYYVLSPPLAQLISGHPAAQQTVRLALAPIASISYLSLHPGFAVQVFALLFLGLGLLQFVSNMKKRTPSEEKN